MNPKGPFNKYFRLRYGGGGLESVTNCYENDGRGDSQDLPVTSEKIKVPSDFYRNHNLSVQQ